MIAKTLRLAVYFLIGYQAGYWGVYLLYRLHQISQ